MSLLENPTGHFINLSDSTGGASDEHTLALVLPVPDSGGEPQGFVRVANDSDEAGTVEIRGIDDNGASHGPIALALDRYEAVHLDSADLEAGNASKGLPEGLGDGEGYWRLHFATDRAIDALAYIRTRDGFVASTHEVAATAQGSEGDVHYVPHFGLGSKVRGNRSRAAGHLRLVNPGTDSVDITIEGRDRGGAEAPEGTVRLTLPAGQACRLSAKELESGASEPGPGRCAGDGFSFGGRFGEAAGTWSLFVTAAGGDIQVMSLLESPGGYLANLSAPGRRRAH